MIAVVVVAIVVMLVMMKSHFISGGMNVVVMNLREKMVANVACLKDEQKHHQQPHPPTSRDWPGEPSA